MCNYSQNLTKKIVSCDIADVLSNANDNLKNLDFKPIRLGRYTAGRNRYTYED